MSVKTCWSRPIAVLDGKERQALRTSSARKPRLLAHTRASATCFSRKARIMFISLTKPMASSLHPTHVSTRERTVPLHIAGLPWSFLV